MISFKDRERCFIIAECSANHGKDKKRALRMVKKAAECGADAIKFQTYTPDTLTIDSKEACFRIKGTKWAGQTLYELYGKAYTPWEWFRDLKKAADDEGIVFFSTAYDKSSVDFLEGLGVGLHKISSFELVDIPLIEYAASAGKPLLLSTGMASLAEINDAVRAAKRAKETVLLKCVSSYPAPPESMNLKTMVDMKKRFGLSVGLSDHTLGSTAAVTAVSLGARVLEKHFTLSKKVKTPDSFFSADPAELKAMVDDVRLAEAAVGKVRYGLTERETETVVFRRSLFAVENISKGEVFTEKNVRSIRPAHGMEPKYLKKILGKKARTDIRKGTPIKSGHINGERI